MEQLPAHDDSVREISVALFGCHGKLMATIPAGSSILFGQYRPTCEAQTTLDEVYQHRRQFSFNVM
jgi:hypothetical protein